MAKSKFKVGDWVRVTKEITHSSALHVNGIYKISSVIMSKWDNNTKYSTIYGDYWYGFDEGFEQWEGGLELVDKNKTIMDKITTFAKNLTLSAEEKALRKVGLKTECGDYTAEAQSIVMQTLCKEREAMLVEIANQKIDEDKNK